MNESTITRTFLTKVRENKTWVTMKHSDRFTVGVPDTSVTTEYGTTWIEKKFFKNTKGGPTPMFRPADYMEMGPQMMTMYRLGKLRTAYYMIFYNFSYGRIFQIIWEPFALVHAFRNGDSIPLTNQRTCGSLTFDGYSCTSDHLNFELITELLKGERDDPKL